MTEIDTRFNATVSSQSVRVEFVFPFPSNATPKPVYFVCDFDEQDDLIGLETLDLHCSAGLSELSLVGKSPRGLARSGRVLYFEKEEGLYVNLTGRSKSVNQRVCEGVLLFDSANRLIGLSAKFD